MPKGFNGICPVKLLGCASLFVLMIRDQKNKLKTLLTYEDVMVWVPGPILQEGAGLEQNQ